MDTHTHTDTQDNYCNPHRACVPRVNSDAVVVVKVSTHSQQA